MGAGKQLQTIFLFKEMQTVFKQTKKIVNFKQIIKSGTES